MSKLTLRAQTVDIAYLPLRQDLLAKNVLMTAQRDFRLSNSLRKGQQGSSLEMLFPLTLTRLSPTLALTKSPV